MSEQPREREEAQFTVRLSKAVSDRVKALIADAGMTHAEFRLAAQKEIDEFVAGIARKLVRDNLQKKLAALGVVDPHPPIGSAKE